MRNKLVAATVTAAMVMGLGVSTVSAEDKKIVIGVALNEEIDYVTELQNALEKKA